MSLLDQPQILGVADFTPYQISLFHLCYPKETFRVGPTAYPELTNQEACEEEFSINDRVISPNGLGKKRYIYGCFVMACETHGKFHTFETGYETGVRNNGMKQGYEICMKHTYETKFSTTV